MDTTDEYIEMCKEARQIQQIWKKTIGDYFYNPPYYSSNNVSIIFDSYIRNKEEGREYYGGTYSNNEQVLDGATWLPRQDQLQAIVDLNTIVNWHFYNFVNDGLSTYLDYFTSMEQLWLAFVMQKIYNKIWNGSEWIVV